MIAGIDEPNKWKLKLEMRIRFVIERELKELEAEWYMLPWGWRPNGVMNRMASTVVNKPEMLAYHRDWLSAHADLTTETPDAALP